MSGTNVNPRELDWSKAGIAWLIEQAAATPKRTVGGKLVKTPTK